jgi:formylglycine-generating enzyme required for sulfatase activity
VDANWHDAVKWCNARSEKDGLSPVYYQLTGLGFDVYRYDLVPNPVVIADWAADGYRLPTEAEWEKAARGGLSNKLFPWGDTISHSQANYISDASYPYDISPTRGFHPDFNVWPFISTSPVNHFAPNGFGLHDMAGNVWEWCWDRYGSYSSTAQIDPRGPGSGSFRILRGGSFHRFARECRTAMRFAEDPTYTDGAIGFRCVRAVVEP